MFSGPKSSGCRRGLRRPCRSPGVHLPGGGKPSLRGPPIRRLRCSRVPSLRSGAGTSGEPGGGDRRADSSGSGQSGDCGRKGRRAPGDSVRRPPHRLVTEGLVNLPFLSTPLRSRANVFISLWASPLRLPNACPAQRPEPPGVPPASTTRSEGTRCERRENQSPPDRTEQGGAAATEESGGAIGRPGALRALRAGGSLRLRRALPSPFCLCCGHGACG